MKLKKPLEGNLAGTSPATEDDEVLNEEEVLDQEEDNEEGTVNLSNTTVPTPEEEENAGIAPGTEPEVDATPVENEIAPEESQELVDDTQTEVIDEETETAPGEIDPETGIAEGSATKTFTQSQVDEIAGKIRKETREKVTKSFFDRYGVNSEEELDDLFGDAQRYTTVQDMFDTERKAWTEADTARNAELASLKESVALLESGIDRNRYEDAKFILKGKGLEVTVENIEQELATHPEWKSTPSGPSTEPTPEHPFRKLPQGAPIPGAPAKSEPPTQLNVLGNNGSDNPEPELSERERAMKLFKL